MGAIVVMILWGEFTGVVGGIITSIYWMCQSENGVLDTIIEGFCGLLLGAIIGFILG